MKSQRSADHHGDDKTLPERVVAIETDVGWLKKFQWWQLGLNVISASGVVAVTSKALGGPTPTEAATVITRLFA